MTDSTLIGIYGLVITNETIYSKDIMEKVVQTDRDSILNGHTISVVDYGIKLEDDPIIHTLPTSLKDLETTRTIIEEIVNRKVIL